MGNKIPGGITFLFRSSQQLPRLYPLKDFFDHPAGTQHGAHPLSATNLPCALLSEEQRYNDTARCCVLGLEVPGHGVLDTVKYN